MTGPAPLAAPMTTKCLTNLRRDEAHLTDRFIDFVVELLFGCFEFLEARVALFEEIINGLLLIPAILVEEKQNQVLI